MAEVTREEFDALRAMVADLAASRNTAANASASPVQASDTSTPSYVWKGEVLDVGGTAGAVLPASANDWSSYFESPTVTKYEFQVPTTSGDFESSAQRGLEGEYRWSLSFFSEAACNVPALITYYTDSVGASVQLVVNGSIVHNADFAGSTIIGEAVTLPIQRGPNRIVLAGNIYLDELALFTGAFLTKGFTRPI